MPKFTPIKKREPEGKGFVPKGIAHPTNCPDELGYCVDCIAIRGNLTIQVVWVITDV